MTTPDDATNLDDEAPYMPRSINAGDTIKQYKDQETFRVKSGSYVKETFQ